MGVRRVASCVWRRGRLSVCAGGTDHHLLVAPKRVAKMVEVSTKMGMLAWQAPPLGRALSATA